MPVVWECIYPNMEKELSVISISVEIMNHISNDAGGSGRKRRRIVGLRRYLTDEEIENSNRVKSDGDGRVKRINNSCTISSSAEETLPEIKVES